MSVWLTIPSARPAAEVAPVLEKWRERGYKIALWRDEGNVSPWIGIADHVIGGQSYPGYATAVNCLIQRNIMHIDPDAEWFIAAGDDTLPDPNHTAEEIAASCRMYFHDLHTADRGARTASRFRAFGTLGVMQPTGDRYAGGQIDRIAGSAWIGREFARHMYQGNGPLWHEYTHMFVDEELKGVAEKNGVYWMRPDLVQLHMHWQRESEAIDSRAIGKPETARPAHMHPALNDGYTREHWQKFKAVFLDRKRHGFPGSAPL